MTGLKHFFLGFWDGTGKSEIGAAGIANSKYVTGVTSLGSRATHRTSFG